MGQVLGPEDPRGQHTRRIQAECVEDDAHRRDRQGDGSGETTDQGGVHGENGTRPVSVLILR